MDFAMVEDIINSHGFTSEPAFKDVYVSVHEIPPEMFALGLYYPDSEVIVIPPDGNESVFLHEMGHRYGHFYFNDISEEFAEAFRARYETNHVKFFGSDVSPLPYRFAPGEPVYQIASGASGLLPLSVAGALLGVSVLFSRGR